MIPRDEFDRYDVALTTAARLARAAVEALLAGSPSPEELAAAYAELVRAYGSAAAAAAVELYRSLRASQAPPASYEAVIFEPDDAGLLAWDVANAPSLPDSSMQPVLMQTPDKFAHVLSKMPDRFSYTDFVAEAESADVSESTAKRWLRKALKSLFIDKQESTYIKLSDPDGAKAVEGSIVTPVTPDP